MKKTLNLPLKGMSVNQAYYSNRAHGFNKTAQDWHSSIFYNLNIEQHKLALKELRENFDPDKMGYAVDIVFSGPRDIMYTKSGKLSNRSFDVDNQIKLLIDCLFLPKNFGPNVPYQCENLNIDDKHLVSVSARKAVASNFYIEITISYCALP